MLKLRSSFLHERLKNYWINLPHYVKSSVGVPSFKSNLEMCKRDCSHNSENYYWEVLNLIINKIEGNSNYLVNKHKLLHR